MGGGGPRVGVEEEAWSVATRRCISCGVVGVS